MATEKNDDNTAPEYCLPPELLANSNLNEKHYQSNKTTSTQKLKDLLLSVDVKNDIGNNVNDNDRKYVSTTTQACIVPSLSANFNDCFRGHRHFTPSVSFFNTLDVPSNDANYVKKKCIEAAITVKSVPESKFGFSISKHCSQDIGLGGINSKLETHNTGKQTTPASTTKSSLIEKVLTEDDKLSTTPNIYNDADSYVFQDSTYDSTVTSGFGKSEWDIGIDIESSPNRAPPMTVPNKSSPDMLLIKQQGTSDTLRQQITQVVGESIIAVLSLEDNIDVVRRTVSCSLVWLQVLAPLNQRAREVLSQFKSADKGSTLNIVSDSPIKDELPAQAEVYVEPLTKEIIEKLCSSMKDINSQNMSTFMPKRKNELSSACNIASTPESTISSASGRTSICSPLRTHSPPRWCRVEHATKEKQRRERIKDSCDQLRVLLPYVKGRKTDMASILEMTVDYLKIVNSSLSQDFHSQVIDIMSNGSPPLDEDFFEMNMAYKKSMQKEQGSVDTPTMGKSFPSACLLSKTDAKSTKPCNDGNLNNRMITRSVSRTLTAGEEVRTPNLNISSNRGRRNVYGNIKNGIMVTKRGCSTTKIGSSNPKKPFIQDDIKQRPYKSTATSSVKDGKTENSMEDSPSQSHYYNFQFPHMFTEGDISANRMFSSGHVSSNDGFAYISHSQINLQSSHNIGDRTDLNNYGNMYLDNTYLPYSYSNIHDSNNGNYYGTEYVNPNAVLPVTSNTPRVSAFASGRKFERSSTSNSELLQNDSADVYNNNNVSSDIIDNCFMSEDHYDEKET